MRDDVYAPPVIRDFTSRAEQLIAQLDADRPGTLDEFTGHIDASVSEGLCPICGRGLEILQGCPVCHQCEYDWSLDEADSAELWSRGERTGWLSGWQRSLRRYRERT